MIVFPKAKINLGLNVVERRSDGYHNLETVFCAVMLTDVLELTPMHSDYPESSGLSLTVQNIAVEGNAHDNLVARAYRLLRKDFPSLSRVHAHLFKNIPTQAGMGGGSSDAAYMIRAMNSMCGLGLTVQQMADYAVRLGADCPFFIQDDVPAYAEGIGEKLSPVSIDLGNYVVAIVKPDIPVPTREAFSLITPQRPEHNCLDTVRKPVDMWRDRLVNDFEKSVFALHPEIAEVKHRLYALGAVYASMSGSGSAVFGLFPRQSAPTADELRSEPAFTGMFCASVPAVG